MGVTAVAVEGGGILARLPRLEEGLVHLLVLLPTERRRKTLDLFELVEEDDRVAILWCW